LYYRCCACNFGIVGRKLPDYVVYAELLITSKQYMRSVTAIEGSWLHEAAPSLFKSPGASSPSSQQQKVGGHQNNNAVLGNTAQQQNQGGGGGGVGVGGGFRTSQQLNNTNASAIRK
jgi:hypothetical protein